jgi:hypothetical protein
MTTTTSPRRTRWRWLLLLAGLTLVPPAGRAAEEPAREVADALARREQDLLRQYRELERSFLRLADLLAASDPRRSALLRTVFDRARQEEVGDRLDTIVQLLEKGQLLKAGTSQQSSIDQLRALLQLLETGAGEKRFVDTKQEVRQLLSKVTKMIARQRDIEGSTEAGGSEAELSRRQAALAEEARAVGGEVQGFAERIADVPGGEKTSPDAATEKKPDTTPDQKPPANEPPAQKEPAKDGKPGETSGDTPGAQAGDKPGEKSPDTPADPKAADPKAGRSKPGSPPADPADGAATPAESPNESAPESPDQDPQNSPEPQGDDETSRAQRTLRRLQAAERRMEAARKRLDEARRRDARQEQEKAVEELETARAELEEILRQMREEEVERLLVQLETRIRDMLRAEKGVLAGVEAIGANGGTGDRERQLEAARLGRDQTAISNDAAKALAVVRDDGSAVAIPQALEAIRDDALQAAGRLTRGDVGGTTKSILQDLVTSLEELLATLEKSKREQQEQKQAGPSGGRPPEPGQEPLVDKLSELKMLRTLQMRVNSRTTRFSQLLADGAEQAEEPELLDALDRLAERQRAIERAAHDIVAGRTE